MIQRGVTERNLLDRERVQRLATVSLLHLSSRKCLLH